MTARLAPRPTSVWRVAWRWRWLLLIAAILTLTISLTFVMRHPVYASEIRLLVQPILPSEGVLLRSRYPQEILRTKYLQRVLFDFGHYVESREFAARVAARYLDEFAEELVLSEIMGTLSARKVHRTLQIVVISGSPRNAHRIALATTTELKLNGASFASDEAGQPKIEIAVISGSASSEYLFPWTGLVDALLQALFIVVVLVLLLRIASVFGTKLDTADTVSKHLGLRILATVPSGKFPIGKAVDLSQSVDP